MHAKGPDLDLAALLLLPSVTQAGEAGDLLQQHLYEGSAAEGLSAVLPVCNAGDPEGCFAASLLTLAERVEGITADLYRFGATNPDFSSASLLMGMVAQASASPTNPRPEPITYQALRAVLGDALADLDRARDLFLRGGEGGDYVVMLDPLRVRLDLDGDGTAALEETLAALLGPVEDFANIPSPDALPSGKVKRPVPPPDTTLGLDRADSIWFAGYTQVFAAQFDMALAHDFEALFPPGVPPLRLAADRPYYWRNPLCRTRERRCHGRPFCCRAYLELPGGGQAAPRQCATPPAIHL